MSKRSEKKLRQKIQKAKDSVSPEAKARLDRTAPDSLSGVDDSLAGNLTVVGEFLSYLAFYTPGADDYLDRLKAKFDDDPEWCPTAREANDGLVLLYDLHGGSSLRAQLLAQEQEDIPDSLQEPPEDLWS